MRQRRGRHDPSGLVRDLAVMLADGGDCLADLRAVADQTPLCGEVASTSTGFRVVDAIASDAGSLERLPGRARSRAGACVKLAGAPQRHDRFGRDADHQLFRQGGRRRELQGGYGFHPLLAHGDETGEALAAELRAGNAREHRRRPDHRRRARS